MPLCHTPNMLGARNEGCRVHYKFIADTEPTEPRNEGETTSTIEDPNALKFVAPQTWVAKPQPGFGESSFDLHNGLDVSEDEVDTVPAGLFNDLFKPNL